MVIVQKAQNSRANLVEDRAWVGLGTLTDREPRRGEVGPLAGTSRPKVAAPESSVV